MSNTRRRTSITLEELPPRARAISNDALAGVFGGCTGGCYPCEDDKECCPGYSCRLATRENCAYLPVAGQGSQIRACLFG